MKKLLYSLPILVIISLALGAVYLNQTHVEPTQAVVVREVVELPEVEPPTVGRLLELTNAERVKAGVKPLVLDERLNQSAQKKADELAVEGWDDTPHVNDTGFNTGYYIPDYMPECIWFSENVLAYVADVNIGFDWWMNSPSHKKAILDARYEYMGLAINSGFVAQHFCDII